MLHAELVHMRLFDLGAEVALARVTRLGGIAAWPAPVEAQSPHPLSVRFPAPMEAKAVLKPEATGTAAQVTMELRLHALGVLSVRFRWLASSAGVLDLASHPGALRLDGVSLEERAIQLRDQVRDEVRHAMGESYEVAVEPERYVVYGVHERPADVPRFLERQAAELAQLVSDSASMRLTEARLAAAHKHMLQYTPGDAVLVGWDHAVIVDEPGQYEDILDVMELANLELLEFRAYDAYLDERLEASFRSLDRLWSAGGLFRSARTALREMSHLRVEFARLTDNLHDTGKVFGDWYMAQLHQRLHERFHLGSWQSAVAAKMDTLEDMFHLAQEEANHRRSLVLELLVVLLFVLDLWILIRVGA